MKCQDGTCEHTAYELVVATNNELVAVLIDIASSPHRAHMGGVDITLNPHTADRLVSVLNKAEETLKEQGDD